MQKTACFLKQRKIEEEGSKLKKGHPINFAHFHISAQCRKTRNSLLPISFFKIDSGNNHYLHKIFDKKVWK